MYREATQRSKVLGVPHPPSSVVQGGPLTLRRAHIGGLADYLHGHPQAYLGEMIGFLFD